MLSNKKQKTISEKSAHRWLNRNRWNISKFRIGVGSEKGSCFDRQLQLCLRSINKNKEK